MLKIYDPSDATNVIPFPIEDSMRYVTHKYSGYDTLTFEMASNDPLYKYIVEETKIEDEKNRYIVKKVDEHSDFVTVVCYVDIDDWKVNIFEEFRTTNKMLSEVLDLLLPAGWSAIGAGMSSLRTTVEEMKGQPFKGVNAADILPTVAEVYSCTFQFNAINKTVKVIDPKVFKPSGYFFTDELNLKNLGFVGDSTNFATRLYAFGKKDDDGNALTFADINDGKPYVEDHSYSDKVISVGWSDERYTVKETLLADAKAKLQELSYPVRSYTCDADKLGEGTWLYQIVTLVDRRRMTRVNHQVVEYKEYPNHVGDSVTLSMTAPRIESYVGKVESDLKNQIKNNNLTMQQVLNEAIEHATQEITGNKGGHFLWVFDDQGRPIELLNLGDTEDINTAKQVWRWNASGLGHSNDGYNGTYTLALLADGSINAAVITTGILNANIIRAGKITDLKGLNYWDLETGEFRLTMETNISEVDGEGNEVVKTLSEVLAGLADDDGLTQEAVFNALTKNGTNKGIYMVDGELYINATYLATGILTDKDGKNYWNLETGEFKLSANAQIIDIGEDGSTIERSLSTLVVTINAIDGLMVTDDTGTTKIKGSSIETATLKVSAANVTGTLTASQINTTNLKVAAANITGTLTASQINATNLKVAAANITGTLSIGQLPSSVATTSSVTTITNNAISTANIKANQITSGTIVASNLALDGLLVLKYGTEAFGYMGASTAGQFDGAVFCDLTQKNYLIVTAGGVRMSYNTSGTHEMFVAKGGCYSTSAMQVSSDKRLKNSISYDMDEYDEFFAGLKPCSFKMNREGDSAKYRMGFIAQDVLQTAIDNGLNIEELALLGEMEDGYYTIGYGEFIPLVVKQVQKANENIKELKEDLAKAQNLITELQERIARLE